MEKHYSVAIDENSNAPFVSYALVGSSTLISNAHNAAKKIHPRRHLGTGNSREMQTR